MKDGDFFDPDTPPIPDILEIAMISAGGAILASELSGFSLCRPPGHHATRNQPQGFCYLNNIAVAVMRKVKDGKKVAILDIDCHHGNGTEEIFIHNSSVIYISLHQSPLYPGTGLLSHDNLFNYPLEPMTDGLAYRKVLNKGLDEIARWGSDLVAVSAGFDTYHGDPLTALNLEVDDYYEIGRMIRGLGLPTFSVLEGGYSSDLPRLVENYLRGLCGG